MRNGLILDLADCTEFRQSLEARAPRVVHGVVGLLAALLGTALAWMALTQADLVVRGQGRVRPTNPPRKVFNPARGDVLSASAGGRVVEVRFREGDEVKRGDVLVRLDTARLESEIAKRKRAIQAGEEELGQGQTMKGLLARQREATRATVTAELAQTEEEIRQAKARQAADQRLAQVELDAARDDHERSVRAGARAVSAGELSRSAARVREAEGRLAKAKVSVEEGKLEVQRQRLAAAEKDYAIKEQELDGKRAARQAEVDAARYDLEGMERECRQAVLAAPVDGVVTAGEVKVGDLLEAGRPVAEIAEGKAFHFEVAVPSEEVGRLQVGMAARVKLDSFDYQRYGTAEGTVCFISPDSGVAQGQQVATYTVRIALGGDEVGRGAFRGRIKLGMAGQAEFVTGQETLLSLLVKKIRQSISLG